MQECDQNPSWSSYHLHDPRKLPALSKQKPRMQMWSIVKTMNSQKCISIIFSTQPRISSFWARIWCRKCARKRFKSRQSLLWSPPWIFSRFVGLWFQWSRPRVQWKRELWLKWRLVLARVWSKTLSERKVGDKQHFKSANLNRRCYVDWWLKSSPRNRFWLSKYWEQEKKWSNWKNDHT